MHSVGDVVGPVASRDHRSAARARCRLRCTSDVSLIHHSICARAGRGTASAPRSSQQIAARGGGTGRKASGHAKAGRRATYLLIQSKRKSPCIYFEWAVGRAGVARAGAGRGQTPLPVWRQKDSPAPRPAPGRRRLSPLEVTRNR